MIEDYWITNLPKTWGIARVKELAELINGYPFDSERFHSSQGMPLIRIRDILSETTEVLYQGDPVPEAIVNTGDILVGMDGDFNVGRWRGQKALLNQRVCCIRPNSKLDNGFLAHFLPIPLQIINDLTYSTTVKHLSSSDIAKIWLPFPPIEEQHAITTYLDRETYKLDTLIAAKEHLLELLAEKRRALITHAVTRGLNPNMPMRDSRVKWLGEIPKHWHVKRIAFLFRERDERDQPELPLLNVSIHTGVTIREFSDDHVEQMAEDFSTYKVAYKNDIAFNKMRMWQGAVGVVPTNGLVSPDYVVATSIADIDVTYYSELFHAPIFSAEAARHSHGIVWDRLRLYWDDFRDIVVPVPPRKEQHEITSYIALEIKKLDELRSATEQTINLLYERRTALIAAAVTGQLSITG